MRVRQAQLTPAHAASKPPAAAHTNQLVESQAERLCKALELMALRPGAMLSVLPTLLSPFNEQERLATVAIRQSCFSAIGLPNLVHVDLMMRPSSFAVRCLSNRGSSSSRINKCACISCHRPD